MAAEPNLAGTEGRIAAEAASALPHSPARLVHRSLEYPLAAAASVLLFAIMAVTVVDVVGRYFLNVPLRGGFELTEVLMAGLIAFGMPLVTAQDEHVKVDLLDPLMSERLRRWQTIFGNVLSGVTSAVVAWTLWSKAGQLASYNDHTEMLRLPLAPVAYLLSATMAITAVVFLAKLVPARPRSPS